MNKTEKKTQIEITVSKKKKKKSLVLFLVFQYFFKIKSYPPALFGKLVVVVVFFLNKH